jgi:hypothetical protein
MFDPNLPQEGTPLDAVQMRSQFNGLKGLIDAIGTITAAQVDAVNTLPSGSPAQVNLSVNGNTLHFTFELPQGQEGQQGQQGPPFAQAVVDGVNTVDPGTPAAVGVSFDGTNVRFTFDIPRGNDGINGSNGSDGSQGPPGNDGGQGPPFAQAVVDGVSTLDPGQQATVQTSFDGSNVRFTFGIPRGNDGSNGSNGSDGAQGPQGPPFAQAVVDGVTTLDPGQQATVQTSFDGSNVRFQFGIPRGSDGSQGQPGNNGSDGPQGPPGEISQAQLNSAINGTSNNTNSVSTLDTGFADPDMEAMRQKLNEMILNGRR